MALELSLRYLHFICLFTMAGALTAQHLLLKPTMARSEIKRIAIIDLIYGISFILLIAAGLLLWLWVGKPAEFYTKNWVFHFKLTLVVLFSLLSLPPTFYYNRHRKGDQTEQVTVPKKILLWVRMELLLLFTIPILAVLMARGIGYFG